jgi:hypothetical protein
MAETFIQDIESNIPSVKISLPPNWVELPEKYLQKREDILSNTSMDLDSLRNCILPNDSLAQRIEASSDSIGWIHGLKAILKAMNLYKWPLDGRVIFGNKKWIESWPNPISKALIDFQTWVNSPYNYNNRGELVMNENERNKFIWSAVDMRMGIPALEIGSLWPVTIMKLLESAKKYSIEIPPAKWDKKLENGNEFQNKYGAMIDYLTWAFTLPKNLIMGIAKQESNLGTNPADYWWWNGIMQLTTAPLADMSWVTSRKWVIDWAKINIFRGIFSKIDLNAIKKLPFGNTGKVLWSSLDNDVWSIMEKLCTGSQEEFKDAMEKVRSWERWKFRWLTYHTVNILVWSAYLKYIQNYRLRWADQVAKIAEMYNGSSHKAVYAQSVAHHVSVFNVLQKTSPRLPYVRSQTVLAQNNIQQESNLT